MRALLLPLLSVLLLCSGSKQSSAAPPSEAPAQAQPAPAANQFRVRFNAYDGDPNAPQSLTFQINTLDLRQPSEFLKVGDTIGKTSLKIVKFTLKIFAPPNGEEDDESELTVVNTRTNQQAVLIYRTVTNLPDAR